MLSIVSTAAVSALLASVMAALRRETHFQRSSFLSFSLQADKIVYYNAKEDVSTTPEVGRLSPSACLPQFTVRKLHC